MYIEIPTAIIGTASTRPITMNICVLSMGISSGCLAAPSQKRPPKIPIPTAAPSAPKPIKTAPAKYNIDVASFISSTPKVFY